MEHQCQLLADNSSAVPPSGLYAQEWNADCIEHVIDETVALDHLTRLMGAVIQLHGAADAAAATIDDDEIEMFLANAGEGAVEICLHSACDDVGQPHLGDEIGAWRGAVSKDGKESKLGLGQEKRPRHIQRRLDWCIVPVLRGVHSRQCHIRFS